MKSGVSRKVVCITTGDRDGVGLEITLKALRRLKRKGGVQFLVACGDDSFSKKLVKKNIGTLKAEVVQAHDLSLAEAAAFLRADASRPILFWQAKGNEAAWFRDAVRLADDRAVDALVTGPISKGRFKPFQCMGHTGLLSKMTGRNVLQGYIGEELAVVLTTDHLPLNEVEAALSSGLVKRAVASAVQLRSMLPPPRRRRPIAVLGLNPHAGEGGMIGTYERRLRLPRGVMGPLSPDTAFTREQREKYSVAVSLYHDQGLIPFKLLHGQDSGFQVSLGLNFVRTSVDHGTATDLFGRGKANPGSMLSAIEGALAALKLEQRTKR